MSYLLRLHPAHRCASQQLRRASNRLRRLLTTLLLAAILAGSALPSLPVETALAQDAPAAAPAAVTDTPIPVVTEPFSAYYLAAGLLYYSLYCTAGPLAAAEGEAQPVQPAAPNAFNYYLKRIPVNGGINTTLANGAGDPPACYTFKLLTADGDGVYYAVFGGDSFNETPLRVESRPGGSATPRKLADTSNATYPTGQRMATDSTYVYWLVSTGVVRARKDGTATTPETVASGLSFPLDLMVIGSTLYIADETAIYSIQTSGPSSCAGGGSCTPGVFSSTGGTSLAYRRNPGRVTVLASDQIYWVNDETIRRRSCSAVSCFPIVGSDNEIVYQKPADDLTWYLGRPAFAGTTMFWQEAFANPNPPYATGGAVRRKVLGSTPLDAADSIADPTEANNSPVFVDGNFVYYRDINGANYAINKLPIDASAIVRDLSATGIEVTQGIQNLANGAPLASRKLTYVRAYGTNLAGPRANAVQAVLHGTRNGAALPGSPLRPIMGNNPLIQGVAFDRARLNDGWLFHLPISWTDPAGGVRLRLVVDPGSMYADPNRANNEMIADVTFQNQPPACAIYVPVDTHEPTTSPNMPNFWDMVGRFQRLWPMPRMLHYSTTWQAQETQVCWWGPFPHPCGGPFELNEGASISDWIPDKDEAIAQLWLYNLVHYAPACDDAGAYTHVMGLVHPQAPTGNVAGYASTISGESWVKLPPASPNPFPNTWNAMFEAGVMAQELAHNFGRKHIDCGNPGDIDTGYPYNPCTLATPGQSSYYGFDARTLTPIRPDGAKDYMTYSSPTWTSDYTWRAIMNSVAATQANAAGADASLIVSADGSVVATGHVDTQKALGQLNYVKVLPEGAITPSMAQKLVAVAAGDYHEAGAAGVDHGGDPHASDIHLKLLDVNNAVLADREVTLLPIDDHDPTATAQVFLASFPAPAGQVVRIQLLDGATLLDEMTPGAAKPVVAISQPAGGSTVAESMTVAWQASDPDHDPMIFNIQYSYDGGVNWQALAGDIPGTPLPNNTITFDDLSNLHGSAANGARVRVIATDGYNTTIATSQPFTLSNRTPVAFITAPAPGQSYDPQGVVAMHGGATDGEDGALEESSLLWKIGATVVATGTDALVSGLAPGVYTATLEAKDSANKVDTETASLRVNPLSIPQTTAATIDGFCDDIPYASGAQVLLNPYSDGSQASLRLVRDANYLWACFSGLKGGAADPGAFAGLRVDVDNSRNAQAQSDDYGFFVGENGSFFTVAGDGAGGFAAAGPGGLQAQISANEAGTLWNAELRISRTTLGGWDRIVGMKAGHYDVGAASDDYGWPYATPTIATRIAPNSWARTALGLLPTIESVAPLSATVGGPSFALQIEGQHIGAGALVIVNGVTITPAISVATVAGAAAADMTAAALPAEVDLEAATAEEVARADAALAATTVITAQIPASLLAAPGALSITVRNPGPLDSQPTAMAVNNATPAISTLAPAQIKAESAAFTLTVNGSGFVDGTQVLWEGTALPTTFDSSTRLRAQVSADLLLLGRLVGVSVRNPAPVAADSAAAAFDITPNAEHTIYLPSVER